MNNTVFMLWKDKISLKIQKTLPALCQLSDLDTDL